MSNKRMGTVIRISKTTGNPEILLDQDGEGHEVDCLTANTYRPQIGDRAVLERIGGRYIAEYAVGAYRGAE